MDDEAIRKDEEKEKRSEAEAEMEADVATEVTKTAETEETTEAKELKEEEKNKNETQTRKPLKRQPSDAKILKINVSNGAVVWNDGRTSLILNAADTCIVKLLKVFSLSLSFSFFYSFFPYVRPLRKISMRSMHRLVH